jgi:hypothetical protein
VVKGKFRSFLGQEMVAGTVVFLTTLFGFGMTWMILMPAITMRPFCVLQEPPRDQGKNLLAYGDFW